MVANRRLPAVPAHPSQTLVAPFTGTVVATPAAPDEHVPAGAPVVVIEAMKMEHEIVAERDATVAELHVGVGDTVQEGQTLATITTDGHRAGTPATETGYAVASRPPSTAIIGLAACAYTGAGIWSRLARRQPGDTLLSAGEGG